MRIRLDHAKLVQKPEFSKIKNEFLRVYYRYFHKLLSDYMAERISAGKLGRAVDERRFRRYRTWLAGAYGSDRQRKSSGRRRTGTDFVEQYRLRIMALRNRWLLQRESYLRLVELTKKVEQEQGIAKRIRATKALLEDSQDPTVKWLSQNPVGKRVAKKAQLALERAQRHNLALQQFGIKNAAKRMRIILYGKGGAFLKGTIPIPWPYGKQTGLLAQAWKKAALKINQGEAEIKPFEAYDRIAKNKSLSSIMSRTLLRQGQRFIPAELMRKASREAFRRAAREFGFKPGGER